MRMRGPRAEIVGRVEELAALEAALEDALGGLGRLVLIAGEAGIGKTRLALEVGGLAEAQGAVALLGRAWDEGGAPTAWSFVELLREAKAHPALARAHAAIDDALAGLDAANDPAARFAAFDRTARALAEATRAAPLVLILDDLHWADAATLVLAKLCVRALARARALLVGTYRDDEARAPEPARLLAELAREGLVLTPRPLLVAEVAVLVARGGLASAWGPRVLERSGGNPFFVEQTVRWIAAEGLGAEEGAVPAPAGARAIVARRLERLPPSARRLVEVAAAIGAEPDPALLAEVCPDLASDLVAAVEHGVLSLDAGRIGFTHDLLRETALATARDLPSAHAAIAAAVERLGGTKAELARRLAAAGDPRAAEVALDAGRRAARRGDDAEAAELLGLALRALRASGEPTAEEVELAVELGEALLRAGHVTEGSLRCAEAARLAHRVGAPDLVARAALAYGSVVRVGRVDPTLVELLEDALGTAADPALRATLEARLAGAMQPSPTPEVPLALARRAIAGARARGDRVHLARVLDLARPAFRALDDVAERVALDREALALAEALGDLDLAIRAEQRLALDLLEQGDVAGYDHHAGRATGRAGEVRFLATTYVHGTIEISRWALTGDFERAERALRRAAELRRAMPDPEATLGPNLLPMMRLLLLRARRREEDVEAIRTLEPPPSPFRDILGAAARMHVGDRAGAAAALDAVFARGDHVRLNYVPAAVLPEVVATLGDADRAATLLPIVEQLAGRCVVQFGGLCEGAAGRLLGLLHATMGRVEDARACFEDALRQNEAFGAAPFVHATKLALVEVGASGALLEEAIEGFGALGMTASLARARALRGDGPAAVSRAPAGALATLRREGELWTLARGGDEHRLKDAHGLHYLAYLLARPGVGVEVAELFALIPRAGEVRDAGDAGPLLDAKAKAAYRGRLADLREQLAEAEAFNDLGRARAAREEMELLRAELSRAVGLGGRDRRASSRTERTRVTVTSRIRKTIQRIGALDAALGDHLDRSVVTGAFCRYDPPPGPRVTA